MYATVHRPRLWHERLGSGPPVVLLHGLAGSHDLWRHQLQPLAARFDVVALDLRGHGQSEPSNAPFTLDDMADDVRSTLEALGLERPVVVGLSMGGGVAQALAVREPQLLRGLVLVSTSSHFLEATRERMLRRADRAAREGMAAIIDETVPRWFTPEFATRHPQEVERTEQTVRSMSPAAFAAASRANAVRNLTPRLRRISCPVLFIAGADDPADPRRAIDIYRTHIQRFESQIIPDASHLVPVEAPERFTSILLRFLDDVTSIASAQGGEA